jgi:hypothetical protein
MEPRLGHAAILVRLLALGAGAITVLSAALAAAMFAVGLVVVALTGPASLRGGQDLRLCQCAKMSAATVADSVVSFRGRHHRWPDPAELWLLARAARDPWGHAFVLSIVRGHAEVHSLGPDGNEDTEDDVVVRCRR